MIDLSEIIYRAYGAGDAPEGDNIPSEAESSTTMIVLDAIKYRAWQEVIEEEE